jgi:hypothetical protein
MTKYQIRFCDSKGHGSFEYIDVKSKKRVEQKAADKATEYINKQREYNGANEWNPFRQPFKPKRIVHVWEIDMETKKPKKGGHRFKLELCFISVTYLNGRKARNEWYEPVKETINKPQKQ